MVSEEHLDAPVEVSPWDAPETAPGDASDLSGGPAQQLAGDGRLVRAEMVALRGVLPGASPASLARLAVITARYLLQEPGHPLDVLGARLVLRRPPAALLEDAAAVLAGQADRDPVARWRRALSPAATRRIIGAVLHLSGAVLAPLLVEIEALEADEASARRSLARHQKSALAADEEAAALLLSTPLPRRAEVVASTGYTRLRSDAAGHRRLADAARRSQRRAARDLQQRRGDLPSEAAALGRLPAVLPAWEARTATGWPDVAADLRRAALDHESILDQITRHAIALLVRRTPPVRWLLEAGALPPPSEERVETISSYVPTRTITWAGAAPLTPGQQLWPVDESSLDAHEVAALAATRRARRGTADAALREWRDAVLEVVTADAVLQAEVASLWATAWRGNGAAGEDACQRWLDGVGEQLARERRCPRRPAAPPELVPYRWGGRLRYGLAGVDLRPTGAQEARVSRRAVRTTLPTPAGLLEPRWFPLDLDLGSVATAAVALTQAPTPAAPAAGPVTTQAPPAPLEGAATPSRGRPVPAPVSAPSPAPVAIRPPRILIIDTETTGFSRARARVVELAVVLLEDGRVVEVRSTLVRASREQLGHPEARSACQTHGIPLRDLLAAPDAVAIGERLGAWYRDLGSPPCAAWPTSFDSRLCRQTWPDLALDWPPGLCIHRLWRGVMGCAPPRLELAAAMLHVPQPEGRAHRAGYDARLTAGVYQALLRRQEASRV